MNIECFTLGPIATNAYLLTKKDTNRAVVIDPGMEAEPLLERLEQLEASNSLEVEAILLTHAHFDHIGGVETIRKLKGCPVYLHSAEADWLSDPELNGSTMWPAVSSPIHTAPAEHSLQGGQTLKLLDETFQVFHTPGHSPGSCSFLWRNGLFSGDVLFRESIGRTDLPGGSSKQLYTSIHDTIFAMAPDTVVYPGHGPSTTIAHEMKNNPFV